jgi:adenylate cyclase class 2
VANADGMLRVFEGLGMRVWFRYEKFRTTYCLPDSKRWARRLLIELDETPIGTFVELEGPSAAIDRAATELGFSDADYILTNYLCLYQQECERVGAVAGDMTFSNGKSRQKIRSQKKKP